MFEPLKSWARRYLSDPQVVNLGLLVVVGGIIFFWLLGILAPVMVSLVIAYLLDGIVNHFLRWRMPRPVAVGLVYALFLLVMALLIFAVAPLLIQQVRELAQRSPDMLLAGQEMLLELPERYPETITEDQVRELLTTIRVQAGEYASQVVSFSLAQVINLIALTVYLILVPMMVFFMLKDRPQIVAWASNLMPGNMELTRTVWAEVDVQIGNYARGKMIEMLLVGAVSFITFMLLDLQFAHLLGAAVGASVLVPFIGAVVVTVPVVLVALFQFGVTPEFWWVIIAYSIIQALDGNVLVPVLFSEVVNLHPLAIVVSVLFFGGLWGVWGVFFAIPLATLVQAILRAWPRQRDPLLELPATKEAASL